MQMTSKRNLTPRQVRDRLSEDDIHRQVIEELRRFAVEKAFWFHPANGGSRGKVEAARFKGLGVVAGTPDLMLFWCGASYALELKKVGGKLSTSQKKVLHQLDMAGTHTAVAYGLDEALEQLKSWGLLTNKPRAMIE